MDENGRRFARIETWLAVIVTAIISGAGVMAGALLTLREQVKRQNGRVTKNEDKIHTIEEALIADAAVEKVQRLPEELVKLRDAVLVLQNDRLSVNAKDDARNSVLAFQLRVLGLIIGGGGVGAIFTFLWGVLVG